MEVPSKVRPPISISYESYSNHRLSPNKFIEFIEFVELRVAGFGKGDPKPESSSLNPSNSTNSIKLLYIFSDIFNLFMGYFRKHGKGQ